MKRLDLLLMAAVVPGVAMAFSVTDGQGVTFSYNINNARENLVTLDAVESGVSGTVDIPTTVTYDDVIYTVNAIGDYAFYGKSAMTGVTLPESITYIGNSAFNGAGLKELRIPDSVTSIESDAFGGNSSLTTVVLGHGITAIPDRAFSSCWALEKVYIWGDVTSIGAGAFYGDTSLTYIEVNASEPPTLGDGAFMAVPTSAEVVVPRGAISAYKAADGWSAFTYNHVLTGIDGTRADGAIAVDGHTLHIGGAAGRRVRIYTLAGQLLASAMGGASVSVDASGVVIVAVEGSAPVKVSIK